MAQRVLPIEVCSKKRPAGRFLCEPFKNDLWVVFQAMVFGGAHSVSLKAVGWCHVPFHRTVVKGVIVGEGLVQRWKCDGD